MPKIRYHFCTGESCEIEVDEKIYQEHLVLEKQEELSNRRETRRHCSLFKAIEKGVQFEICADPLDYLIEQEEKELLHRAMKMLEPEQQSLLEEIFFKNTSVTQVAKNKGVSQSAVSQRLLTIYKKIKKFL